MTARRQYSVTLSAEVAEALEECVRAGVYADINDAISQSVDHELEEAGDTPGFTRFVEVEVHAAAQELDEDPDARLTTEQVFARVGQRKRELLARRAEVT
ncbi:hypothetical protein [Nesterenkonia ebinurensis]|uniref:hypothetical protein n=1 Tax=Nesterenkonia ebinurensis TaxID=2608252 RepID=UPI00123D30AD|nr:hypothetical protein [Nesterenkonia ebinurensis]